MIEKVKVNELERACEFLQLDFRTYINEKNEIVRCSIQYPFEDSPIDYFTVINGMAINNEQLAQKIEELRGHRARVKELQNEIKLLTKGQ